MVEKKPLFMGDSEIDQIFKIFTYHGTPSEKNNIWPGIFDLPDFKPSFPKFRGVNVESHFKNFDKLGLDLCTKMVALDPAKRISVKEALRHPYFNDLKKEDLSMYEPTNAMY